MIVFPPRDSNASERLSPTSENKVLPWQNRWNIFGISFENKTKYHSKRSDHFAAVFRWSPSSSANRILYKWRMRKEASGSTNTTPEGQMAQPLLAGERPSDLVLVQLQGRMGNKSVVLQFSRRRLVLNMI